MKTRIHKKPEHPKSDGYWSAVTQAPAQLALLGRFPTSTSGQSRQGENWRTVCRLQIGDRADSKAARQNKSRCYKSWRGEAGFSLLELLVAVSIMIVIVYALYQVFNHTQKALRGNITQVDVLESGRAALEMISRELEQLSASRLSAGTNLYAGLIPSPPLVQTDLDETRILRTNVLQEFFFLSSMTNRWVGTGYRVIGADDGIGTLYRFSISTNVHRLTSTNLSREFMTLEMTNRVTRTISTNFHRVADGIVHLRLAAFDPEGRRMGFETTNFYPTYNILRQNIRLQQLPWSNLRNGDWQSANVVLRQDPVAQTKLLFLGNALPAYVDLELAVIEPDALAQYESMRVGPPSVARKFLEKRASKVHLFRKRIPIRTASP
ncbi:MAG: hypothetical protein FJ403_07670 [Verrucomicrobia bacterium]|nr:hypothetical protein [Verrucomicrobiota bacterium]